jgi:hypothetical protein
MADQNRGLEEGPQEKGVPSVEGAQTPLWGDGADGWIPSRLV